MKKWLVCLLLALAGHAVAAPSCTEFTPNGQWPVLTNPKMVPGTRLLCYSDFAVLHSGITHGPLWSAEHLSRAHIEAAKDMVRTNRFFEDARLPESERATLADYRRSGFDRGHMSPAGNRWNAEAMAQSFSLANVVPQNHLHNQQLWSRLETAVRKLALKDGEVYVLTGPMFVGEQLQTIGANGVFVPTQLFKLIYVPSRQLAFGVVSDNAATRSYQIKTVHELEAASNLRFPGIPENLKDQRPGGLKGV
ncbi:DNA/RNA non-specific endonuclease [Paraburkholderia bonniea]|uniref:DNA/RNA non-specific endonuclease n=1 Tax=Paraburkholderia bonniea TaxID=2152891 RepID=UPI00129225A8|nr:DNA/RNA non-specific endonuclease [Paraburkholderia bonniea]WJF91866.1 DNA/RNA non-specific endonuclease [Paraburkholderia bonniea]WJF95185.1 DNA/RNA non-specific endonuclease [Paraburkholderia bonniea]